MDDNQTQPNIVRTLAYKASNETRKTNTSRVFTTQKGDKLQAVLQMTDEAKTAKRLRFLVTVPPQMVNELKDQMKVQVFVVPELDNNKPSDAGNEISFEMEAGVSSSEETESLSIPGDDGDILF